MVTIFVALQCAQCSTMQVKQQKKRSNKWVCVVCNLRQSVCRIYAKGPRARDLRQFVQDFNMSRMKIGLSESTDLSLPASDSNLCTEACQPKKTVDWSEYMDSSEEENEDDKNKETEVDVEIVTEMPPKSTYSRYQQKNFKNNVFCESTFKRKRSHEGNNKQSNSCSSGRKEAKIHMSNQRSRWNEYLDDINEEEIGDETVNGSSYSNSYSFTPDTKEKIETEHLVEDEVHPDFM